MLYQIIKAFFSLNYRRSVRDLVEEQAAIDRQVLSGVLSQLKHQATASINSESSSVSNSQIQKVSSVKSPKHSKQGSSVSVKGQVEPQKEGQYSGIQLTKQQQGSANTGARSKSSASHVIYSYIQPVSKCSVPFQDSVYHMSNVHGVRGQHSVVCMVSNSDAQMTHQGLPGTGLKHNSHSGDSNQIEQGSLELLQTLHKN